MLPHMSNAVWLKCNKDYHYYRNSRKLTVNCASCTRESIQKSMLHKQQEVYHKSCFRKCRKSTRSMLQNSMMSLKNHATKTAGSLQITLLQKQQTCFRNCRKSFEKRKCFRNSIKFIENHTSDLTALLQTQIQSMNQTSQISQAETHTKIKCWQYKQQYTCESISCCSTSET